MDRLVSVFSQKRRWKYKHSRKWKGVMEELLVYQYYNLIFMRGDRTDMDAWEGIHSRIWENSNLQEMAKLVDWSGDPGHMLLGYYNHS